MYSKYANKGLTGLANIGNTCFLNSCIQVLSHTYELNELLETDYHSRVNKIHDSVLLIEWDNLRKLMWSQNCTISPGKFVRTLHNLAKVKNLELLTGFSQNDLPECLLFVIDSFHNSLSREVTVSIAGTTDTEIDKLAKKCYDMVSVMYSKDYSEIWKMFYGIHVSQITDDAGAVLSSTPEPFFMIDLPIPANTKTPDLIHCFDFYVEGERMEGDCAWFNEATGLKQDVCKKIMYWSFPDVLVISIKRFNNKNIKNQSLITFPLDDLNLSKYVVGYGKEKYVYDLYGVCNHSGNVYGGHYTAFVKNANGKWYHFNDTHVSEVTRLEDVVSPKAYCLFYRKKLM